MIKLKKNWTHITDVYLSGESTDESHDNSKEDVGVDEVGHSHHRYIENGENEVEKPNVH